MNPSGSLGLAGIFSYLCIIKIISMKKYLNIIINFLVTFLFGVRIEGEPIDLSYPEPSKELPPVDAGFFTWCREYRVGCLAKGKAVSY
jgi:hypothetical protein